MSDQWSAMARQCQIMVIANVKLSMLNFVNTLVSLHNFVQHQETMSNG